MKQRSGGSQFKISPRQIVHEALFQKNPSQNRAGGVAQVVESLPNNCEALSSNPSAVKTTKKGPELHFVSPLKH
jgi:hypothetical protein